VSGRYFHRNTYSDAVCKPSASTIRRSLTEWSEVKKYVFTYNMEVSGMSIWVC
jgi:hypothetical protein